MTRRILIVTAGETPQLITETIFGLQSAPEPWMPDELLLATTASGRTLFENGGGHWSLPPLLGANGKLAELYHALGRSGEIPDVGWIMARRPDGSPCADIRSNDEVDAFAEALFASLVKLTADPETEIHLSIAGGRKTMSFIAGQVMSFCARHRDRMSHCLVSPAALESNRDFWWPSPEGLGADARIDLHDVHFLKVAAHLKVHKAFPATGGWADGVHKANDALAADELTLDFTASSIRVGETQAVAGKGREFAVMAVIAIARKLGWSLQGDTIEGQPVKFWRAFAKCQALLQLDRIYDGEPGFVQVNRNRLDQEVEAIARDGMSKDRQNVLWTDHWGERWQSPKSRLKTKLKSKFADSIWPLILPDPRGRSQIWTTHFDPEKIHLFLPGGIALDFFLED